jgi:hypothetical protein
MFGQLWTRHVSTPTIKTGLPLGPNGSISSRVGLCGWLMQTQSIATARARWRQRTTSIGRNLEAARTARRLARAALPFSDLPEGGRRVVADMLYREAARRSVCALLECDTPMQVERALAVMTPAELGDLVGSLEMLDSVRGLFRRHYPSHEQDMDGPHSSPSGSAGLISLTDALIRSGTRRHREYPRLVARVALRWLIVAVGLCGLMGAVLMLPPLRRLWSSPNLIAGADWTASSAEPGEATTTGQIPASVERPFFFHTAEDSSPSIEIQIPGPLVTLSRVVVDNRRDCCSARTLPLAIELSNDRINWSEVGRRSAAFERWSARFEPRTARWIRLRVLRRSRLHLQYVAAYR